MKRDNQTANGEHQQRIEELLAEMTLREKLGQCVMIEPCFCLEERTSEEFGDDFTDVLDPAYLAMLLDEYHIGSFLFGGISRIGDGSPAAWSAYISRVREYADSTRLGIPVLFGIDAVHGVNFLKGSTIFTHNLAVAGSWNPPLAERYAATVGAELTSIGFNCNFAPTVDVARDTRWGRVYESLGEDPQLAAAISGALVGGMQHNGKLAACAKHFIGYGESNNGMDRTPADLSDHNLLENHVPPFAAAIDRDVLAMMVSGGDVNGVPVPASRYLLTDLLRHELGFKGVTMSDWEDVERLHSRHKIAADRKTAIVRSFNAGLDMNMAVSHIGAVDIMEEAIKDGSIAIERLNQAVGNILLLKFKSGLFSRRKPTVKRAAALVGSRKSRQLAKQLAADSITLLKNENAILPLNNTLKSILVTGPAANSKRHLCGGWTLGWAGAEEADLDCSTILDAVRSKVSPHTRVSYAADLADLAKLRASRRKFDVCISVVSEEPHAEWFGDSMELGLEEQEDALLQAAVATGIPVVMVAVIGRPLNITWADANVAAMLWTYLPGTEGAAAVTEILFGDICPSGRLPISFPRAGSQVPMVYNARNYESADINTRYDPLYEFGYGLSYTSFQYSELRVPAEVEVGGDVEVKVRVKNSGTVDGCEIVQLYLRDRFASVTRPLKSLKAFTRVSLRAGQSKTVRLTLSPAQLSLYNEKLDFVEEPRAMQVLIGDLAAELRIIQR